MSDVHSWARQVESLKDIPEDFKKKYEAVIRKTDEFPYTVYSPHNRWGSRNVSEKLICLHSGNIIVLTKTRRGIEETTFLPRDIDYLRRRTVLLHAWLNISGVSRGQQTDLMIEYNTVVKELFSPVLKTLRLSAASIEETGSKTDLESIDYYNSLEYRFRYYTRDCMLPGEKILAMCFQPVINAKRLRFHTKKVSNAHLNILTDKEWIFINEGELKAAEAQRYEDIYTFIPLSRLSKIAIEESNGLVNVNISLKGKAR